MERHCVSHLRAFALCDDSLMDASSVRTLKAVPLTAYIERSESTFYVLLDVLLYISCVA
jgi:hypothetical protein